MFINFQRKILLFARNSSQDEKELEQSDLQTGQVGVIVLLTMVGMLTIGLSLAARTTQESFLSGKEAETARVFNAAEQGVEQALSSNLEFDGDSYEGDIDSISGIEVDYTVEKIDKLQTRLFEAIPVGVTVDGFTAGDRLRIDWSELDDCGTESPASLIVSVFNEDAGSTTARNLALGACDRSDGFELASTINEAGYRRRYDVPLETGDFLVRVKPVYNDAEVNIYSNDFDLPIQSYLIRSEAAGTETDETRIVEVNSTLLTAPSILNYALFSGGTLAK